MLALGYIFVQSDAVQLKKQQIEYTLNERSELAKLDSTSNQGDTYCIENGEHTGKKIPAGSPQAIYDARLSKLENYRRDHPRN